MILKMLVIEINRLGHIFQYTGASPCSITVSELRITEVNNVNIIEH